jgi:hypothetical protein
MAWWSRVLGRNTGDLHPHVPIRFDTDGWTRNSRIRDAQEWSDALGNTLRLEVVSGPAAYVTAATDLAALREWCRFSAAQRNGGIVSADLVEVGGRQVLQIIDKFERLPSYDYEGTLILPLRDGHCRFIVRASEHGTTGMREAIITGHLVSLGELDIRSMVAPESPKGGVPIPGWFTDPYDRTYKGRTLRSLADDRRLDGLFPDHPLSRVRAALTNLCTTVELDDVDETDFGPRLAFASSGDKDHSGHEMSARAVGTLLLQMGRSADAQTILAESLKRHAANGNVDPVRIAGEWHFLGFACEAQGQLESAEGAFHEAATRFAVSVGARHISTAQAVNNRARMLIARQDADGAEPLFRLALEVFESEHSKTSDAAVALNGLGLVHIAREQYQEAVGCFERAVGIFERVHGPAFPDTATALRNTALAWKRLGDMDRMAEAWQRADRVENASRASTRR